LNKANGVQKTDRAAIYLMIAFFGVALALTVFPLVSSLQKTATITFAGDVLVERTQSDGSGPFVALSENLTDTDLFIAGLSGPLSEGNDVDLDRWSEGLGSVALGLAGKHTMAFGKKGLKRTRKKLSEVGIYRFGAGKSEPSARRPLSFEKNGIKIAILNYVRRYKERPDLWAGKKRPGAAALTKQNLREDIRRAKKQYDVVVVFPEWGTEGSTPTRTQERLSTEAAKAGADLIVGHHIRNVQPVTFIEGVPVLYSLGPLMENRTREGLERFSLMPSVVFSRKGVKRIKLNSVLRGSSKEKRFPQPADPLDAKEFLEKHVDSTDERMAWTSHGLVMGIKTENEPPRFGQSVLEVWTYYLAGWANRFFLIAGLTLLLGLVARRSKRVSTAAGSPGFFVAVLLIATVAGLAFAWSKRAIVDDAFISFRYAENLLEGRGLVFNEGERVEGYTNFLWTVLMAGLTRLSSFSMPIIAFFSCLAFFVANLFLVSRIGKRLSASEPGQVYVPLAAVWLALQHSFHSFATTGLETMFAVFWVLLGIDYLSREATPKNRFLSGLFLIASVLTRPDHAIFYGVAAIVVAWREADFLVDGTRAWFAAVKRITAYAAPFSIYAGYLAWKWTYYGSLVPNTFYAKSADQTYWEQGVIFLGVSGGSAHLGFLAVLYLAWLWRDRLQSDFTRFALIAIPIYLAYVVRVGGDFMLGRFLLVLMPIVLLCAEGWVHRAGRSHGTYPSWRSVAGAALILATLHGMPLIEPGKTRWHIADENSFYRLASLNPIVIRSGGGKTTGDRTAGAMKFRQELYDRGVSPVIATGGIGIVSYYSNLPLIDNRGLTDKFVARSPIRERGRPGHEKWATSTYLDHRNVLMIRKIGERPYSKFDLGGEKVRFWFLYRYDQELLQQIADVSPGFSYTDFPDYLDREYRDTSDLLPAEAARLLVEFDHYYFNLNKDTVRRKRFTDRFVRLWEFDDGRYPDGTTATGSLARGVIRPLADKDFSVRKHQGAGLVASSVEGTGRAVLPEITITGDRIGFLMGGKKGGKRGAVVLLIDGKEITRWTGKDDDRLRLHTFDVQKHKGRKARIELLDASNSGRILFDMFFEAKTKLLNESPG
jgi:capsule synthesis protein PGA_cap